MPPGHSEAYNNNCFTMRLVRLAFGLVCSICPLVCTHIRWSRVVQWLHPYRDWERLSGTHCHDAREEAEWKPRSPGSLCVIAWRFRVTTSVNRMWALAENHVLWEKCGSTRETSNPRLRIFLKWLWGDVRYCCQEAGYLHHIAEYSSNFCASTQSLLPLAVLM